MTKYRIESLTHAQSLSLPDGWTPYTCGNLACIDDLDGGWLFDTMTEAALVLFHVETSQPRLTAGMNFVCVPVHSPDPQQYFNL
jgi:ribulose-5-phosphate 4-epimerase/fuculose-1-phosphate aldolase